MDLNDKWKKAVNKAITNLEVSEKNLKDNIILKTKKEINSEIVEATELIKVKEENDVR